MAFPVIQFGRPALVLAPMEGVTDAPMRFVQGVVGAFDFAVSEFLRVSQHVPPRSVFWKHIPELKMGSLTANGLPVQVQLLGGDAGRMAAAAALACELGAGAIDINFGCPAKTVNRHDGGATLLKYPLRIREIVSAIRAGIPSSIPVSAKLRLGWDALDAIDVNASMAAEGGANWITIHGRTRAAGYSPPIYWNPIGRIRKMLNIPVVANGDIWTLDDFRRCRDVTGCEHFMLGRGALARPGLIHDVRQELLGTKIPVPIGWQILLTEMQSAMNRAGYSQSAIVRRAKQWLSLAARYGEFDRFDAVKRVATVDALYAVLD